MNSADLPITEWWDPEWGVYDVPLSPFDDDGVSVDTWWAAYEHLWVLGWIMHGEAPYIPAPFAHQLEAHAYPGQPAQHPPRPVKPCICAYYTFSVVGSHVHHVETIHHGLIPTYGLPAVSWFEIHPACPHHGTVVRMVSYARTTVPRWMVADAIPDLLGVVAERHRNGGEVT